ncbi:unnamed protein product [Spirodela intermedia]|uniref:Uncharacterized protein n=1 Tax=Spirodela intermedia TaxID=51605 RepID=A0A7I8K0W6_SPIIN|nr:unnamed protein product [Spirodela intermedia]
MSYRPNRLPPTAKRYVLRLFISLKYITANVVDRRHGRVVATASSVEKALKPGLECGRFCNAKAAAAVGEVLAVRLKVDGLAAEEIHADVAKEIEKKGFKNRTKVWAVVNALRSYGVNLLFDADAAAAAAAASAAAAAAPLPSYGCRLSPPPSSSTRPPSTALDGGDEL